MQKEIGRYWYSSWFDTPYYHILYKDRDQKEARDFMNHLTAFLQLPEKSEILDLACGKGRHSVYLNELGYDVIGVDLSSSSIAHAKQFENQTLHFKEHDMCVPYPKKFDAVFNLFTSFGYFEAEEDNLRTIKAIKAELKSGGYGVIDFLNAEIVIKNLISSEVKVVEHISFNIKKYIQDGHIIKDIHFEDDGIPYNFTEKVKALTLNDFQQYFSQAGVVLKHCFGDYRLSPFDAASSERLILIFN
ncbi:MAG: class I SAM-dependent methyltransferase [Bacteroidota bacterium]